MSSDAALLGKHYGIERPSGAAALAALVRDAHASRVGLRIAGAGTWLDAGHPVRATRAVSLRGVAGIVAYQPEDLTLTCGAGTTLEELDAATRKHGQWCPLLPWGDDTGTVGATVATASEGPFAESLGRPRNLVLGLECVDGTGRVIAAGARVVKNVAGFDLTRAMIGAWGTLGVLTQLHLRLRARPPVSESWALAVPTESIAQVEAFARGPLAPLACVRIPKRRDSGSGAADRASFHVHLGGNQGFVAASRAAMHALGGDCFRLGADGAEVLRALSDPPARAMQWRWDALSLRLRDRFDPHRILNPGLLGEPA